MAEFSITEWLEKAKQDNKQAAIPIIVIITVVFLGYKLFYSPKKVELLKQEKRIKSLQAEMAKVQNATTNADDITAEIESQKKKFENAKKLCYKKSEMTYYLRHIKDLATKANITIKSINPRPLIPINIGQIHAEELPVSFAFEGDIVKLGTFLRLIELEDKITYLKLPKLIANKNGNFNLNLEPTVIIIPDNFTLDSMSEGEGESEEEFDDYE